MKYNVWLRPHLPLATERESNYYYWPKSYTKDKRLNFLDAALYIAICGLEQLGREYSIDTLIGEVGSNNPDKQEELFQQYAASLGKTEDDLTRKEFREMLKIKAPLIVVDIEESLKRLEKYGYIKKVED